VVWLEKEILWVQRMVVWVRAPNGVNEKQGLELGVMEHPGFGTEPMPHQGPT
jgi:hypothetical protein